MSDRILWQELYPQAASIDEIRTLIYATARQTVAQGLTPCTLCGEAASVEDTEMVEYFCQRCLNYQIEVGGEFSHRPLQQPHEPCWLELMVKGQNGPQPLIGNS